MTTNAHGSLECRGGNMPLSSELERRLHECYVVNTRNPRDEVFTYAGTPRSVGGQWFCPGCGVPVGEASPGDLRCSLCGRSMVEFVYSLIERHPHAQPARRRSILPIVAFGCLAVAAFDTVASLISLKARVSYASFALPSLITYVLVGIMAARRRSLFFVALAGLSVSLFDATVGWWISWKIGPGQESIPVGVSPLKMTIAAVFVVAFDTIFTVVCGAAYRAIRFRRTKV